MMAQAGLRVHTHERVVQLYWENEAGTAQLQMLAGKTAFGVRSWRKRGKRYGAEAESTWVWIQKGNKCTSKAVWFHCVCTYIHTLACINAWWLNISYGCRVSLELPVDMGPQADHLEQHSLNMQSWKNYKRFLPFAPTFQFVLDVTDLTAFPKLSSTL